jgi:uncharacterized membrane protein
VVTAWILAIGRMLGLGSIAGIRPSLTLAVIGVVGYFGWGVETNAAFSWLNHPLAIGTFVVLAILESTFDKIAKLDRLQDRLIMPYRLVVGGIAGASTIPFGWQGIVAGAAVGAGASWFAQYTKHLSRPRSVPSPAVVSLISAGEELVAFFGSILVLAVPYFGYACVGVSGVVYWRLRTSRRSKYRKMRKVAAREAARAASSPEEPSAAAPRAGPPEPQPPPSAARLEPPGPPAASPQATAAAGDGAGFGGPVLDGADGDEAADAPPAGARVVADGPPRDGGAAP